MVLMVTESLISGNVVYMGGLPAFGANIIRDHNALSITIGIFYL